MRINAPSFAADHAASHEPRPRAPSPGSGSLVWLVRHAEVHEDWRERAYGNQDVALSAAGIEDTRRLSGAFRGVTVARVTSSHLARALAMGRAIADVARAELAVEPALREIGRGDWQGLPATEFRARWLADEAAFRADPWNWKAHGGESDADVFARAWPVLVGAASAAGGGTAVLTTHFNVIRVLVSQALGLSYAESFAFRNDLARATLLADTPRGFELVAANVDDPAHVAAREP